MNKCQNYQECDGQCAESAAMRDMTPSEWAAYAIAQYAKKQ